MPFSTLDIELMNSMVIVKTLVRLSLFGKMCIRDSYKAVLEGMNGKPVVVRTMDIGGDKELPYFDLPKEMNPFLGYRALRISISETGNQMFRTQLRCV